MRTLSRRRIAPLVVAGICLAGVAGSFGQSSASPAPSAPQQQSIAAIKRPAHRLPDTKSLVSGVVGLATAARDSRAKVDIFIPPVDGVAYLDPKYRTPASQVVPVPKYFLPAHPVANCTYEEGILYTDLYAVKIRQKNAESKGVVESVGQFPDAKVSALAFGSIPVTATLHTHQIRRNGKLQPITANTISSFLTVSTKDGSSCDPNWESGTASPPAGTISRGQLAVRISNVEVDRQPLDVGSYCHTVTPLNLNLWGREGYIAYVGGTLIERYDPVTTRADGNTYPVHPGSSDLTLPAFTGCVNPHTGEDYSRLLTAMVSGPGGTVAVRQSTAVLNGISNRNVTLCQQGNGCVKLPRYARPPKAGMTISRTRRH